MIKLNNSGVFWINGKPCTDCALNADEGRKKTMAAGILRAHDTSGCGDKLKIKFDSLISHDITYVGIIQTAKASGLEKFPVPYVMTNCHNSLCAVGGTINEDDHMFGLSAAKKYGGIYVPANQAVIHQYAREMMAGCGKMILGSDSHTRYGALGTMGVGEGGPELVKQLLERTYDIASPAVVLVYLTGKLNPGVGPHDVAIALCGATYKNGFVKNKVLEFAGPGVKNLSMDYRIGIDVMTTETACLSSVWETDEKVEEYLKNHGRGNEYKKMSPEEGAYYDAFIEIDLSTVVPMAALPFHPSEAYTIAELKADGGDILREVEVRARKQFGENIDFDLTHKIKDGKLMLDQGIIAGCAGGMFDNIAEAAAILDGHDIGCGAFSMSVYPPSIPVNLELIKSGVQQKLLESGVLFKPCFCGPCFGAGDVPSCGGLSARHTTRNFPNREGSKPAEGQLASVILMDARSIAATARNHGALTGGDEFEYEMPAVDGKNFDANVYSKRVYFGFGKANAQEELQLGPNITEWPKILELKENLLLRLDAVIHDPVTTTDELIPSGDASSYRSNPMKLATFALSRREPEYVSRTKVTRELTKDDVKDVLSLLGAEGDVQIGSVIFANKPGDGSAREQAASCQRILGGCANICYEFATKRYRSNCINWGMLPFTIDECVSFDYEPGDFVYVPGIRSAVQSGQMKIDAKIVSKGKVSNITLSLDSLTDEEKQIIVDGCLMNYYAAEKKRG